jgi:hypothetical protein
MGVALLAWPHPHPCHVDSRLPLLLLGSAQFGPAHRDKLR